MHCHEQVKLNWKALFNVLLAIAIAAFFGFVIDKIYSFESVLFDVVMYMFAAYLPFLLGQKLFLKIEEN